MSPQVVFLVNTPSSTPGLLSKIFLDSEGVRVFYQPLTPHLDLYAQFSNILMGDGRVPPGYFLEYIQVHGLCEQYPQTELAASLTELLPFLRACVQSSHRAAVFEVSGHEHQLASLLSEWPGARVVSFEVPPAHGLAEKALVVSRAELIANYQAVANRVLGFCGLPLCQERDIFFSSDWVRLCSHDFDQHSVSASAYCGPMIERQDLQRLLQQRSALMELGHQEAQLKSLGSQLQQMTDIAEERLKLLEYVQGVAGARLEVIGQLKAQLDRPPPPKLAQRLKSRFYREVKKILK